MKTVVKPNLYASLDMIPEIGTNGSIQWLKHLFIHYNVAVENQPFHLPMPTIHIPIYLFMYNNPDGLF